MTKKIKDNESIKPLIGLLKTVKFSFNFLDKVPFIYKISPQAKKYKDQFLEIEKMSDILYLPDQFNELFAIKGWIYHDSLPKSVVGQAVQLAQKNNIDLAHELLIQTVDETYINLILLKCENRKHFQDRFTLLKLLKTDYLEQRYHACTPLLLALLDGLANDVSNHIGFFTENLDLALFDSMTAHETGLPFLKTIMNSPRKKTTAEEIQIPYRNGILHGRDLNFNNKEVASKCWWALASLIDWADEKQLNKLPKEPIPLRATFKQYQETHELSQRIEKWQKRPCNSKNYWINQNPEINSPEYVLLEFLKAWQSGHWGEITPLLLHNIGKKEGKTTKDVVNDYKKIKLLKYQIMCSEDQTPATTQVLTYLEYTKDDMNHTTKIEITLNYANSKTTHLELRGEPDSKWYILQASLSDILFT